MLSFKLMSNEFINTTLILPIKINVTNEQDTVCCLLYCKGMQYLK